MGAYTKPADGGYQYNTESSYDYEADGYITDIEVLSKPAKTFCGTSLIVLLANTIVRLKIQKGMLLTAVDTDLLSLLGNSAKLNLTNPIGTQTYWEDVTISFNGLIDDSINHTHFFDIPSVVDTGSIFVKFAFSNWTYRNTYDNVTSTISFDIATSLYPQLVVINGEITDIDAVSNLDYFNITGYYNSPSDYKGSFKNYLDSFTLETNLGVFSAWDLCKYGYTFTPSKVATPSKTFSGNQSTIVFQSANSFFQHVDNVGNANTIVTIELNYFDNVNEVERTLTFDCDLRLYGLNSALLIADTRIAEYYASYFPSHHIYQQVTTSNGNTFAYRTDYLNEDLYTQIKLTITNTDTSTTYTTNQVLPNGHYNVALELVVNPSYSIFALNNPLSFALYQAEPTDITVESMVSYYNVNNEFDPSKLIVNVRRLIYGSDYHLDRIYYPEFTTNYDNHVFDLTDVPSVNVVVSYYRWQNDTTYTQTISLNIVAPTSDNLYIFNKKTLEKVNYGEIQQGFNFNFVLDKTKDNAKIEVLNRYEEDIKPFTIAYLESTDTWWIVKSDIVTRYESEQIPLYKHEISLLGAIEILNARDLTTCGFNVDRYTLQQFFNRLVKMIDFEMPIDIAFGTYLDPNKIVDYLKTFENYTPLSAIKEMCDGMNVKPELNFVCPNTTITKAILTFVPNSGTDKEVIDIDTFNDTEEKVTSDNESYGSKVVSNIQNCTSGGVIRFPSTGSCCISSSEHNVKYASAQIRLPSKAKEVKALYICGKYALCFGKDEGSSIIDYVRYHTESKTDVFNDVDLDNTIENLISEIENSGEPQDVIDYFVNYINNNLQQVKKKIQELGSTKLENGADYDNTTNEWNGKQIKLEYHGSYEITDINPTISPWGSNSIGLNEKRFYDTFSNQKCLIYWEQGSDLIKNFVFFDSFTTSQNDTTCEASKYGKALIINKYNYNGVDYGICIVVGNSEQFPLLTLPQIGYSILGERQAHYVVEYIPQNDVKVKVENGLLNNDTNLYNQNGTLVSSKAVSKLVNSHAKAISSNEITRYKRYYDFHSIPKIGQIVDNNGEKYVINNVSIDFAENDSNLYALDCMFTMTKQIACKSTMISANSVIRDYPTPQNNNVRRIQCYRDYILLSYESYQLTYNSYLPIKQSLGFLENQLTYGGYVGYIDNHTAFIQISFNEAGTLRTYYYQLSTIKYDLDKMFIEVVDFKDNNIIGYAGQSTSHPFSVQEWYQSFTGISDQEIVPISYVNEVGELGYIQMLLVDNDQLTNAYDSLKDIYSDIQLLYTSSCIIPKEIYDYAYNNSLYDINLLESDYDKDGLEIPVFQYSCQIDGKQGVEIGTNFLRGEKADHESLYVYHYKVVDNAYLTEENALLFVNESDNKQYMDNGNLHIYNNVRFNINTLTQYLELTFYNNVELAILSDKSETKTLDSLSAQGKTILIYRNRLKITNEDTDGFSEVGQDEFVMALNYCNQSGSNGQINIKFDRYKLK